MRRGGVELAEGLGVVGGGLVEEVEEIVGEGEVVGFNSDEAKFGTKGGEAVIFVAGGEGGEEFGGELEGCVGVGVDDGEEGLGKAGEVPRGDGGLLIKGVASVVIDGAEGGVWVVGIEEGAGAVVEGFP